MRIVSSLVYSIFLILTLWSRPAFSHRDLLEIGTAGACVAAYAEIPKPASEPAAFVPIDILSPANKIRTIRLEPMTNAANKSDPNFGRDRLRLVEMLADTIFVNASRKLTVEKGELHLGHDLGDGRSLEFEYEGDQRSGQTILRLVRILLYKPNGQSIVLSKSPVADSGRTLAQESLGFIERSPDGPESLEIRDLDAATLKSWAGENKELAAKFEEYKNRGALGTLEASRDLLTPADQAALIELTQNQHVVRVPLSIEGPLKEELDLWIKRLPYLSRFELASASTPSALSWLTTKARGRATWAFTKDRFIKKMYGVVILVGLLYGVEKAGMVDISAYIPGSNKIEHLLHGQRADAEALVVRRVFGGLNVPAGELRELERKAEKRINRLSTKHRDTAELLQEFKEKMAEQEKEETARGGKVRYSNGAIPGMQVPGLLNSEFGYLIGDFPKQEKVVFVPVVKSGDGSPTMLTIIPVNKRDFPEIYDRIQLVLNNPR